METIIVIGGGVAGITAAIKAKNNHNEVIVLEKNKSCLKKILITGNGHCNYFNDVFNANCYTSSSKDLLNEIINDESKQLLIDFYNSIGLVPRIKNGYYYPYSNQAYAVLNALMKEVEVKGVKVEEEVEVKKINYKDIFLIETNKKSYKADKLIIATGSKAAPKTGSTGDGYMFAKSFNHSVNSVYPALVQLITDDKYARELDGVRADAKVTLLIDNNALQSEIGEIQFTNYGLSGICIYNLSLDINKYLSKKSDIKIRINLFDGLGINTKDELDNYLTKQNSKLNNRTVVELLEEVLNYKIVNMLFKKHKIANDITYDKISKQDKDNLLNDLVSYEVKVTGTKDFENAQVCSGGIDLNEIDITSFESKKISGLYFVGELLDVTGKCGGYNISFAILSGIKAGKNIGDNND